MLEVKRLEVPYRKQKLKDSCGPANLAMVLSYLLKRDIEEEELYSCEPCFSETTHDGRHLLGLSNMALSFLQKQEKDFTIELYEIPDLFFDYRELTGKDFVRTTPEEFYGFWDDFVKKKSEEFGMKPQPTMKTIINFYPLFSIRNKVSEEKQLLLNTLYFHAYGNLKLLRNGHKINFSLLKKNKAIDYIKEGYPVIFTSNSHCYTLVGFEDDKLLVHNTLELGKEFETFGHLSEDTKSELGNSLVIKIK